MSKTAFVTGASGFVGLNLVEELLAQGWQVTALHRATSDLRRLERLPVRRVIGDVTDFKSLLRVMPRETGAVFHVAGNTTLWSRGRIEQLRVNVRGTRNMVRAALETGARRFVHTSSIVAYGLRGGVITEDTPPAGINAPINYVRSKALAEREVRRGLSRGLPAVIVNPAHIMGPYDEDNWSRLFRLIDRRRLPAVPGGGGSFCHVRAVARAHIAAAERGRIGANYLLGGADSTYLSLAQEIARLLGRRGRFARLPVPVMKAYARVEEWIAPLFGREPEVTREAVDLLSTTLYCSSRRAVEELGYQPLPLSRLLEDCHRWMRESGLLRA